MGKRGPKGYSADKIVALLRDIQADIAQGSTVADAVAVQKVSLQTYYKWKKAYGTMGSDEVKRLKELEDENARLRKLVADLSLDKDMLQEVIKGKY
jgi:putative transposase